MNAATADMSTFNVAKGNSYCFTEGTQIVVGMEYDEYDNFVQYVTVNIEDVQVGDLVYSYDTATGEVSQKAVTSTSALRSDHINLLTIVDEDGVEQTIETTDSHPFWVVTDEPDLERAAREVADGFYHENIAPGLGGFWVEAKDLRVGDVFLGANGELTMLINAVRIEQDGGIAVFNFTVEGNHNYFILAKEYEYGQSCVLVHNGECGYHDHHIVMKAPHENWMDANRQALLKSQRLLERYGIKVATDMRNRVKALNEGHTIEYTKKVYARLQSAVKAAKEAGITSRQGIRNEIYKELAAIGKRISKFGLGGL